MTKRESVENSVEQRAKHFDELLKEHMAILINIEKYTFGQEVEQYEKAHKEVLALLKVVRHLSV